MNLKKFIEENIAIRFADKEEKIEFLKECEKQNLYWNRNEKATDFMPYCNTITYKFEGNDGLGHSDSDFYSKEGYTIIDYKDFKKGNIETKIVFEEIEKIIINKDTTIVFWNDDTKTLVKRAKEQSFNKELAILYAYFIKHSGLSKTKSKKVIEELIDNIYVQSNKTDLPKLKRK